MPSVLDLLFPKRCINCKTFGNYICANCFAMIAVHDSPICVECQKGSIDGATHEKCRKTLGLDGATAAVIYRGVVKKLVYQFKYDPYLSDLQKIISDLMIETLIQNEVFMQNVAKRPLLIPTPLYKLKERKRGYNQAKLLASLLSQKLGLEMCDALLRIKATKPQFKLNREERLQNIHGVFMVKEEFRSLIKGKRILLVDDVATSYATFRECAKVLKRAGVIHVWGVSFAKEL